MSSETGRDSFELRPLALPPLASDPCVSVLLTNHNYGQYVGAAIQSVLDQDYPNKEIIIVDDASNDGSLAVIRAFESFPGVRVIARAGREGSGHATALNIAFAAAGGDVICFLDADDVYCREKVSRVVATFRDRPAAGFGAHQILHVDRALRPLGRTPSPIDCGWLAPQLFKTGEVSLPGTTAIALRRPIAERLFPLPTRLLRLTDAYINLTSVCLTHVAEVPGTLAQYRIHGANSSNWIVPDVERLRTTVTDMEIVAEAFNEFLHHRYDASSAPGLRLERNRYYCEMRLALACLDPSSAPEDLAPLFAGVPDLGTRAWWRLARHVPQSVVAAWLTVRWGSSPAFYLRTLWETLIRRIYG